MGKKARATRKISGMFYPRLMKKFRFPRWCVVGSLALACGGGVDDEDTAASTVLDGDMHFRTAASMATFCMKYTGVSGDLILALEDVLDTDDLACLESVGGGLLLRGGNVLVDFSLPNLSSVEGVLMVQDAPALRSIALPALQQLGDRVILTGLPALEDLDLSQVSALPAFHIEAAGEMTDLSLPALEQVEGILAIVGMPKLKAFSAPKLERINGDFDFVLNSAQPPFDLGLENLAYVAGDVYMTSNRVLQAVEYENLAFVGENLYIDINDALLSVSMPALVELGALNLETNDRLERISFPLLETVEISVYSYDNGVMTDWSMPVVKEVGAGFVILRHQALESLEMPSLQTIHGDLEIYENDNVAAMGFDVLGRVGGNFFVHSNPRLPQSIVDAILAQLGSEGVGGEVDTTGNAED